jgi:leucyl-tRNA synthetase
VSIVKNDILDTEKFKKWMPEFKEATFILEDGQYLCGSTQEKMSKSLHNVVNPDYIIDEYGADTLRLYEMFLGPIEQSKPWNTSGIEGVSRFLNKVWKLCHDGEEFKVSEEGPKKEDLIILHTMLKKVETDLESFSLNTAVSAFMICVNDLLKSKTKVMARAIIRDFTIALSSFAPHLSQEIWEKLGEKSELSFASFPKVQEELLVVSDYSYPVSLNGKMKFLLDFPIDLSKKEIEVLAMGDLRVKDILEGKTVKKIIIVPGKIINFVV